MMLVFSGLVEEVKRYWREKTGALAIIFGIMAPVIIGIAGLSLDLAQAYLVKQRLGLALDAAALAAVASESGEAAIRQKVIDFFDANYPMEEIGVTFEPQVQVHGDEVTVIGYAQYHTLFLRVVGVDVLDISADTTVVREVQGIEVVLVLDNTGSMSENDNIGALRTAASNFVYIMYGIGVDEGESADPSALDGMSTRDRSLIKIGMVPYSTSVNVGPYGLGKDLNGDYYGESFVNNPNGYSYTTNYSSNTGWLGCVLAGDYPYDTVDHEGPWEMYRYCRDENDNATCNGYWYYGTYYPYRKPNHICPRTPILPLSTSPTQIKESIDTMRASGHTYGNFGMVWGYRVLSDAFPFEEGQPWDNQYWRKAIVMMTDGKNTMHPYYSAYGRTQDHNLGTDDLNNRFAEVCQHLKDEGAIIYTVTFYSNVDDDTKAFYRACATSDEHYFDAPGQEDLVETFEVISRELSQLHITD